MLFVSEHTDYHSTLGAAIKSFEIVVSYPSSVFVFLDSPRAAVILSFLNAAQVQLIF